MEIFDFLSFLDLDSDGFSFSKSMEYFSCVEMST